MKNIWLLSLFLLLPIAVFCQADQRANELTAARAAVKANLRTEEGCKYDAVISAEFQQSYAPTMGRCAQSATEKDLANFELLIRVAGNGKVDKVLFDPGTKIATCLAKEVAKNGFSTPPKPMYWVHVEMKIEP